MSETGIRQRITAASLLERRFEVTRALIPCAGTGSRLRTVTNGQPKELLEVGGLSAVEHVLRECAASLVQHAIVLVGPGKDAVAFKVLKLAGTPGYPKEITLLEQPSPLGLADALGRGRDIAPAEPLALALPSVLYRGDRPALAQVISSYRTSLHSVAGIVEARAVISATKQAASIVGGKLAGEEITIETIPDVGVVGQLPAGSVPYALGGRFVFAPDAWVALDAVLRAPTVGERDIAPVLQRLLMRGQLKGKLIRGRYCDLTVPAGYADALQAFASG
ncbi:MAG: 2-C-methyl-D-erythritol 4-phosphate cytidylyltransferase [Gemmatimonadetes bacterium]|nr:2-C-methyl-D-erythritol 4-phosphate cytidylyltransferase [Gemmatimonadota bacterium]